MNATIDNLTDCTVNFNSCQRSDSSLTTSNVSDLFISMLRLCVLIPVHTAASLTGVVTNVLNMIVQHGLGLRSSMGIGVFMLSLTDFMLTFLALAINTSDLIFSLLPETTLMTILRYGLFVIEWIRYPGFFISSWITVILSLEKCFAVTLEWQVERIVLTNGSIADSRTLGIEYNDAGFDYESSIDLIFAIVLSVSSNAILIISTFTTMYFLKVSSRIRQRSVVLSSDSITSHTRKTKRLPSSCLTPNETRMVKVVLSLSLVLITCNIPRYLNVILLYAYPYVFHSNLKLVTFVWVVNDLIVSLNCSGHFFVYWLLNKKFRDRCRLLLKCKNATNKTPENNRIS
ncbi:neuromedin-U receptor 2 [Biomphalaria pfeifferi]|uniref:Neuromedin-U receptor 2 n=1 Tax=Biomphalaria pfeifferi TaxID=112525 RepID=A0AAD8B2D5_BIOPF|nr:neuromedin-U receptor 2 [Biomphalaria pfeifferi]